MSKEQTALSYIFMSVTGDFNHADLKSVFLKDQQGWESLSMLHLDLFLS